MKHESERENKTKWKKGRAISTKPQDQKAEKCNSKAVALKKKEAWNLHIYLEADEKHFPEFNCLVKELSSNGQAYPHPTSNSVGKHSVLE